MTPRLKPHKHAWNASCLPSRRRRVTALPGWVSAALGCCCRFSLSWQLCAVCLLPAETFFVMPYVTSTRLRIVPACAGAFCKAFILGIDQGNRPAESGRPSYRRPVCGCSVAAAQFAGGVRLGGLSGRAAALQALLMRVCYFGRSEARGTVSVHKVLTCTVPCARQLWTLCMLPIAIYRVELCFID